MSSNIKTASKRLSTIVLSFLVLLSTMAPMLQAFAADSTKGIETKVDRTELDNAVQSAKDEGVPIQKDSNLDKGVATNKSEVDAKVAEIKQDYENQIKAIKAEIAKKKDCDKKQKEYETAKKKYDKDLEEYNIAKKKYDDEMVTFNKAMAELENHKHDDGYLSKPEAQLLQFKSEPNASMRFVNGGKVYSKSEWQSFYNSNIRGKLGTDETHCTNDFNYINSSASPTEIRTILHKGQPLKVEYTNLENSYFNGKKISKVEYTYTLKKTGISGLDDMPALIEKDPAVTIWYINLYGQSDINLTANFYDEDGHKIDMTGALLSFSSLNNGTGTANNAPSAVGKPMVEKVLSFNGEYINISGSSVKAQPDGGAYSSRDNEKKANGSRFSTNEWDDTKSEGGKPTWYGAIVGKVKSTDISLNIGASKRGVVWFALNSDIRAIAVPNKPIEPVPPVAPLQPQCPNIQANYHYDILYYQPPVEKKVNDENNTDINNKTVLKDAVVKFILNVADLPAGHEKIDSLVFTDKLPAGYKADLVATKQSSPDYDVNYDEGTNEITFSAKSDYINTVNADLSTVAKIAAPVVVGKVTKAGVTYKNDFTLTINNDYSVKSKPVKVHTPTEPKKEVFKGSTTTKIDGKIVQPEEELTYAITYKNTTGNDVNAAITDKIPAHTKFVSAENGGTESGGVVTWNVPVAKDQSVTVKFTVKVDKDVNGAPIDNKARVNDGTNEFDTNETHNPTPTEPKKEVFKGGTTTKIDGKRVDAGQELTYAITYKNTTGNDVNATITDKLPKHTSFVSAENGGAESGGVVTWNVPVAKNQSITVKFTVKVDKNVNGAPIDNIAKVNDGTNSYDTNETHNPTPTEPKKEVFKYGTTTNIDGKQVQPGQKLTYQITYKNTTGEERDVTITDKLPAHTSFVSADNGGKFANGKITWTAKVADGDTFKVTFTVKVDKNVNGEILKNTAIVNDGVNDFNTNTVKNPTPKVPKNPDTGDFNNIMLLILMLLGSSGALVSGMAIKRRREE